MKDFDINKYVEDKRKEYSNAIEYHTQQITALTGALQALDELEKSTKSGESVGN